MYYLERNEALFNEAKRLWTPQSGKDDNTPTDAKIIFRPSGSFYSSTLGREVHIGTKRYTDPIDNFLLDIRARQELAVITAIAEYLPGHRDYLPLLYGVLKDKKGEETDLVMEDFSQGGQLKVETAGYLCPTSIVNLFGKDILEEDYTVNMAFNVGDGLKFGDFFPFFESNLAFQKPPLAEIMDEVTKTMDKYSIRI